MSKKPQTQVGRLSEFLKSIEKQTSEEGLELPPTTRALYNLLKNANVDEQDYKAYLLKKYR